MHSNTAVTRAVFKTCYWDKHQCWTFDLTSPSVEEAIQFFFHKHVKYIIAYWCPDTHTNYKGYVELTYTVNKMYWDVFVPGKFTPVKATKYNRLSIPLKLKNQFDTIDNGVYFGLEKQNKNNFSYREIMSSSS